jgi:GntR family transcriptional repressor for pyruvate dehydrogenase complex
VWKGILLRGEITSPSLTELTVEAILEMIRDRGLASGDQIPAAGEIAKTLNVSRPVVREALATLTGLGVLKSKQGRESVITVPGSADLSKLIELRFQVNGGSYEDIQEFRELIEVSAAGLAAMRADERDVAELRRRLEVLEGTKSDEDLHDADVAFHEQIASMGQNDLLKITIEALAPLLRQLRTRVWAGWKSKGGGIQEIFDAHADILECIANKDEAGARKAMAYHLSQARTGLMDPSSSAEKKIK